MYKVRVTSQCQNLECITALPGAITVISSASTLVLVELNIIPWQFVYTPEKKCVVCNSVTSLSQSALAPFSMCSSPHSMLVTGLGLFLPLWRNKQKNPQQNLSCPRQWVASPGDWAHGTQLLSLGAERASSLYQSCSISELLEQKRGFGSTRS